MIIIDIVVIGTALIFFTHAVSNKFLSHEESDALNEPCALFGYFDYHDIWHFMSAFGIFTLLQLSWRLQPDITVLRSSFLREPLNLEFDNNN